MRLLGGRSTPPYLRNDMLTTGEGSFRVDLESNRLERRLAALDRAGIDVALISLQPTLGIDSLPSADRSSLVAAYHDGIAELVAASDHRLRSLAAGEFVAGFDGVCVGASRLVDPGGLDDVLGPLQHADGILFVHPDRVSPPAARAPAWWTAVAEYTADVQAAYLAWVEHEAGRWHELRVVFALLAGGAAFQLERLESRGLDTRRFTSANVYLETSSYGRRSIELSLAAFGVGRIVHGSDYPVIDPERTMSVIRGLGDAAFTALCSRNPAALLEERAPSRRVHAGEGSRTGVSRPFV